MNVEDFLNTCGLQQYVDAFKDAEVTMEALQHMTDDQLATVVPKVGSRVLIQSRLSLQRQQTLESSTVEIDGFEPKATPDLQDNNSSGMSLNGTMLSTSTDAEIESCSHSHVQHGLSVDLCRILEKHALGAALIHVKTLDVTKRKLLVDILADDIIVKYERPSKSTYLAYAKAITEYYPGESAATYYIPSSNQSTPYGKLYFKVINLTNKMKRLGVPRGGKGKVKKTAEMTVLSNIDTLQDESEESFEAMCNWLLVHQQPQGKLLEYWKRTAKRRLSQIHGDNNAQLSTILSQWPRYRDADGFILISEDFAVLQPSCCDKMATMWPRLSPIILDKIRKVRVTDKQLCTMMECLKYDAEITPTPEAEMAMSLMFLPLLLPESALVTPSEGKSRKRSVWKPSAVESLQYFVDIQQPGLDLRSHLEKKAEQLLRKKMQLQPHVVVLCSGKPAVDAHYVYYAAVHSTVYYETTSLLEAVDICLKAAFVFGLQFPPAARSTWTYVQRAVYGIKSSYDQISSRVLELITDTKID